ncbi:MAG: hypothetical protein APR63_06155 [Desulfuromonas sp. SDB]|nr:MAG: hypothetical protein APR63_06155 [Desulfuromonas sp. SDB]
MKTSILFLFIILLITPAYTATWQRAYGGSGDDCGNCVIQDSEGYYVVVGYTTSFGAGGKDIWILKVDSLGDTVWTRTYGGVGDDEGIKILEYPDHNYIVAGTYQDENNDTLKYICLLKYDRDGNLLWDNISYQDSMYVNIRDFRLLENGNFLGCGFECYNLVNRVGYIVRLDSLGNVIWDKCYDHVNDFYSIDTTENNGFIVTEDEYGVIKYDSLGDTLWSNGYGWCYWFRTIINIGYGYVFVTHWDDGIQYPFYFIFEIDSLGNVINWYKNSGESDALVLVDLEVVDSSQYIGCGWYGWYGGRAYLLTLYNNLIFDNYFLFNSLDFTNNREYIVNGVNAGDLLLVKTDSTGSVGIEEQLPTSTENISIQLLSSNIIEDNLSINLILPFSMDIQFKIFDISGRFINNQNFPALSPGIHNISWSGEDEKGFKVSSGTYFYLIESEEFKYTGKVSIIR